jgi:hypothetical protein
MAPPAHGYSRPGMVIVPPVSVQVSRAPLPRRQSERADPTHLPITGGRARRGGPVDGLHVHRHERKERHRPEEHQRPRDLAQGDTVFPLILHCHWLQFAVIHYM